MRLHVCLAFYAVEQPLELNLDCNMAYRESDANQTDGR